jgi:cyclohexadienyl dehydratase
MFYKTQTYFLFLILSSFAYSDIRVGTTGDYTPFSTYNQATNTFTGKDIDLIKQFAESIGQTATIIHTSWKNSAIDLSSGKFDVFVGGVTINSVRSKSFTFSRPLMSSYKAAMTNCDNISKYNKYSDIDSEKNLVIENRGGTNESFAISKFKHANILIINDNQEAIASLYKGVLGVKPDIMITDSVEITYQHSINSKLCMIPISIDNKHSQMAFMFNQNSNGEKLANEFNTWLDKNPKILKEYKKS